MRPINLLRVWLAGVAITLLTSFFWYASVPKSQYYFDSRDALEIAVPIAGIAVAIMFSTGVGCWLVAMVRANTLPKWLSFLALLFATGVSVITPLVICSLASSLTPVDEHGLRLFHGEHGMIIMLALVVVFWCALLVLAGFTLWFILTPQQIPANESSG